MGQLIAMCYPTKLFLNAADHTYVRCCTTGKKAWGCWGGKARGTPLRSGLGSTARADAIAGSDERAGISCYLINGVCHQAANRIMLPAGITVMGARGYGVSEALFGTYGRPRGFLGLCNAPFNQYSNVTGDLAECVAEPAIPKPRGLMSFKTVPQEEDKKHRAYLDGVLKIYAKTEFISNIKSLIAGRDLEEFHVELFAHQTKFRLGAQMKETLASKLQDIRRSTERSRMKIEDYYTRKQLKLNEFVDEFNRETKVFQHAIAGVLSPKQYKALFGLAPGETIVLADPDIVKNAFSQKLKRLES